MLQKLVSEDGSATLGLVLFYACGDLFAVQVDVDRLRAGLVLAHRCDHRRIDPLGTASTIWSLLATAVRLPIEPTSSGPASLATNSSPMLGKPPCAYPFHLRCGQPGSPGHPLRSSYSRLWLFQSAKLTLWNFKGGTLGGVFIHNGNQRNVKVTQFSLMIDPVIKRFKL